MANSVENGVLVSGEKTVAAAGTAEELVAAAMRAKSVVIIAKGGNTGQVYIGGSDVASATNDGLDAGESIAIEAKGWLDLFKLWVDSDVNAEGVDFYAVRA